MSSLAVSSLTSLLGSVPQGGRKEGALCQGGGKGEQDTSTVDAETGHSEVAKWDLVKMVCGQSAALTETDEQRKRNKTFFSLLHRVGQCVATDWAGRPLKSRPYNKSREGRTRKGCA